MPWFSTVSTKQTNVAEPALLSEKGLHEGVVHTAPVQIDGKAREWLHTRPNRGSKAVAIFRFIFRLTCNLFLLRY